MDVAGRLAEATKLLDYALHLRMYGENAPGGNETWRKFDRRCEEFLRAELDRTADEARRADDQPGDRLAVRLNANTTMTRGKAAAQAIHAALELVGAHHGGPVIVLGGKPAEIEAMSVTIRDAGRTELVPGTLTAGAEWQAERRETVDNEQEALPL